LAVEEEEGVVVGGKGAEVEEGLEVGVEHETTPPPARPAHRRRVTAALA
jgi:hypothetical protein